jgi:hypothetical protein
LEVTQTEFQYVHTAKERERLLQEVSFGAKRNRTLIASILNEVNSFPAGKCYVSEETLGKKYKASVRSVQRAIVYLQSLDLLVVERRANMVNGVARTLNHYAINWMELERKTAADQAATNTKEADHSGGDQHDTYARPTRHLEGDQHDTCAGPTRHLEGTNTTLKPDQHDTIVSPNCIRTNKNNNEPDPLIVVVRDLGVVKASEAVAAARARGLEAGDVQTMVDAFAAMSAAERMPSKLFNWLTIAGSFQRSAEAPKQHGRGDALTREEQKRELLRYRIVRQGRAAGLEESEIENQLQAALIAV